MFKYLLSTIFILISTVAATHSWYPYECCSGPDCFKVLCDELTENNIGNYVYQGVEFAKEQIKPSLDSFCHVCISNWGSPENVEKIPRCAFIQLGT